MDVRAEGQVFGAIGLRRVRREDRDDRLAAKAQIDAWREKDRASQAARGIFATVTVALTGFLGQLFLGVVLTRRANRVLKTFRVAYVFTTEGSRVASDALTTTFSWGSITGVARYPAVFFTYPIPFQRFLAVPIKALTKDQANFIFQCSAKH